MTSRLSDTGSRPLILKSSLFAVAIACGIFAFFPQLTFASPLYVVRSSRGVVTFTSHKPSDDTAYEQFKPGRLGTFSSVRYRWGSNRRSYRARARITEYDTLIEKTATDNSVDPVLVKAVVHVESAFNPYATSNKGAMGLMQLMPGTARRFGVKNAYHPEQNLNGGTQYLKLLLSRYSGNMRLALAAYNAGEEIVDRLKDVPPYAETQDYVRKVLQTVDVYRCAATGKQNC